MNRHLLNLFLVAFGSICIGGTALQAQSYIVAAKVPFAFNVGDKSCSAGKYVFQKRTNEEFQSLRNVDDGCKMFIGATPQSTNHGRPRIVFHRYGNEYFLSEIWNSQGTGTQLRMSKAERRVRESYPEAKLTTTTLYLASAR